MALLSAHKNDIGRNKSRQNEDYIWVDDQIGLYIVADGMGGHEAGDVASELAATTAGQVVIDQLAGMDHNPPDEVIKSILLEAAEAANQAVYQAAHRAKQKRKMGTTIVMTLITPTTAYISHAGDSRAYRLRDGAITQLTEDDTWNTFVRQSSGSEVSNPNLESILTKAIGQDAVLDPSFSQVEVVPGDVILLCSDGLWNMVDNDQILAEVMKSANQVEQAAQALVEAANAAGGKDNISVVVIKILPS
ncbi:MAG: serine/threonine-protein phosphatase [Anaerolineaceae bacterium]|nr:serine/threonine-protein phosphatase [Anaerolineaceae bacterium]MCB9098136.1 serine/threonine-protein phosphatase [Anaerolineales bacterium]